jgi:hypothetical protein
LIVRLAVGGALLLMAALNVLTHRGLLGERAKWPRIEERVLVPTPREARFLSLGYGELAADLAWIRTLVYYGDGLEKGFSLADVEALVEVVNALDPRFYAPYRWGAFAITYRTGRATQEEFRASARILERGMTHFPKDWELPWLYGLRHAYDLRSDDAAEQARLREVAATYLGRAMRLPGAPADIALTVASLRTGLGQKDRALRELREMILTTEDPEARLQLERRYAELASETARTAVAEAATEFEAEWRQNAPFAPPTLHVLLGPRPTWMSLRDLVEPEVVILEDE